MGQPVLEHLIEEILFNAHIHREVGSDLIEEYFMLDSSLDHITNCARKLLDETGDLVVRQAICKNLSECIVVKAQNEQYTLRGLIRRACKCIGFSLGPSGQVRRAEQLLFRVSSSFDRSPLGGACADE